MTSCIIYVRRIAAIVAFATTLLCSAQAQSAQPGTPMGWGFNYYGELGDGTTSRRTTPVQVANLANVTVLATGSYFSVALKNDGTVWAWGQNAHGELGDGSTSQRSTAAQIANLTGITALAAGDNHTLAL